MATKSKLTPIQKHSKAKFYGIFNQMQDLRMAAPARSVRLLTGGWTATQRQIRTAWMPILKDQALMCEELGVDLGSIGKEAIEWVPPAPSMFDE